MFKKLLFYAARAWQLGPSIASMLLFYRLKKALFITSWRHKKHAFAPLTIKQTGPITVTILGFGSHTFSAANTITWHQDFFVSESPKSWQHALFANITIPENKHLSLADPRQADIKVPWELSRLHCLHGTSAETTLAILSSWMENNPFPYGVNWLNPMEVGIRAINIIAALKAHANSPLLTTTITAQLKELLRYHAYFIEHCWEVSSKPNNHYLADLVGYLHLCCFLDITKYYRLRHKAWRWVQKAFKQQLLDDSTCYEGSTAYHKLVTELFDVALSCAAEHNVPIDRQLYTIQQQMHAFIADCTDQAGNLVLIGDDDSGKILAGCIRQKKMAPTEPSHHYYPNFGLTTIRQHNYFFTLRHASYAPLQPTGHFHGDELAITLSINGIPVFIDPGTYLYTAHPRWRNTLRAASAHTTVVPENYKSTPDDLDLFQLPKIPHQHTTTEHTRGSFAQASNTWQQTTIMRSCKLSEAEIIIDDVIACETPTTINWYWHLGPGIEIVQVSSTTWLLTHHQISLATLHTPTLPTGIQTLCASKLYGFQEQTTGLSFLAEAQKGNKMMQQFRIAMMS